MPELNPGLLLFFIGLTGFIALVSFAVSKIIPLATIPHGLAVTVVIGIIMAAFLLSIDNPNSYASFYVWMIFIFVCLPAAFLIAVQIQEMRACRKTK